MSLLRGNILMLPVIEIHNYYYYYYTLIEVFGLRSITQLPAVIYS